MKRIFITTFVLFLLGMVGCGSLTNSKMGSEFNGEYPLKWRWEAERGGGYWDNGNFGGVGNGDKGYDFDTFINSKLGESIVENLADFQDYGSNQMNPVLVAKWASRGIKKELFNYDPQAPNTNEYAIYTPLEAFEPGNETKKYPVVFVLHGNNNPIMLAETYGYVELSAEKKFITVIPYANNHATIVDDIDTLMAKLRAEYPIDESRIYAAGYSAGGVASFRVALAYPGLFAAIAPGGTSIAGFGGDYNMGAAPGSAFDLTHASWADMKTNGGMPVINLFGTLDGYRYYPIAGGTAPDVGYLEKWLEVNGITEDFSSDDITGALNSSILVEKETGFPFPYKDVKNLDSEYSIGEYRNSAGQPVLRVVCIEDLPHWPSGDFASVAWDFLRHWSRNTTTHRAEYAD
jgi:pimeloyl-ACP methyl ester carboxylesterase